MAKFSDNLRRLINPNKQKLIEFNRSVGLNDDAQIIPMDQMQKPHDAYFIRVIDNPNSYVKFQNGEYVFADGHVMACLWDWKSGKAFVDAVESPKLGMVRMDEVLKTETQKS